VSNLAIRFELRGASFGWFCERHHIPDLKLNVTFRRMG
jgi:hypothetical protein